MPSFNLLPCRSRVGAVGGRRSPAAGRSFAMEPPTEMDRDSSVPLFEDGRFAHGSLVRFQGIVQDMFNTEFYLETYEVVDVRTGHRRTLSGRYMESTEVGADQRVDMKSPLTKNAERHTFRLVSVPALNPWVSDEIDKKTAANQQQNDPTERAVGEDESEYAERKRFMEQVPAFPFPEMAKQRVFNIPIPQADAKAVLAKLYDGANLPFKLNDMVQVVGYLSLGPYYCDKVKETIDFHGALMDPPPRMIPTIYVVRIRKLEHFNPLLGKLDLSENHAQLCKRELRKILTHILLGDELAADYLICHLISRVYRRNEIVLGNFPLNLFGEVFRNGTYPQQLYRIIQGLVEKSHYLPLSVSKLNDDYFIPKRNYETDRLMSGTLQLSESTHLVVDETKMQPGNLSVNGTANFAALARVAREQQVKYDFKYCRMDYDCDLPVLVLSEGPSLLKTEIMLPLCPDDSSSIVNLILEAAEHYLKTSQSVDQIRTYLTLARLGSYSISEDSQYIYEDYTKMREEDSNVNQDYLHRLLVLTRLLCLSEGYSSIKQEIWESAKQMEKQRLARLARVTNI